MSLDIGDAAGLLDSFLLHLRAERKSPQTVKTYGDGIRLFLRWCEADAVKFSFPHLHARLKRHGCALLGSRPGASLTA